MGDAVDAMKKVGEPSSALAALTFSDCRVYIFIPYLLVHVLGILAVVIDVPLLCVVSSWFIYGLN